MYRFDPKFSSDSTPLGFSCSISLSESDGQVMPTYLAQFVTLRRQLVLFTHVSSRTPYVDPVLRRRRPALASGSVR